VSCLMRGRPAREDLTEQIGLGARGHESVTGSRFREACEEPTDVKGGWTATASVDCGSGRPANGTPREALPQCAATAPPKTSRGTASYCIARPARGESTSLFDPSASASTWSTAAAASWTTSLLIPSSGIAAIRYVMRAPPSASS